MGQVYLIANGDLRLSANQACENAQREMEWKVIKAFQGEGVEVVRAHKYNPIKKHGFIDSQRYGIEVFRSIPVDAPIIVAEAVWQYSHHILPGLIDHKGPILTIANWSGTWPGLVGLLNINACLTKAGIDYSTIWSEDFDDDFFLEGIQSWLKDGTILHDLSHVHSYEEIDIPEPLISLASEVSQELKDKKAIMGIFDEGCMGMYNAIIPDELLFPVGVFKERLSQSTLFAKMMSVPDHEAHDVYEWMQNKGVKFNIGHREQTDLTERQIILQCKMYIAAIRIAEEFGCDAIGIQYQQGLKDLCPASDLAEGLLNNVDRPPVFHEATRRELFSGEALPHFNEVDECAGLDALVTYRLWRRLGLPPETTLHDVRWGRYFEGNNIHDFVWVFQISGAAPPAHYIDGYKGTEVERQPAVYFPLGGGTLKGISKPGYIVWSRIFVEKGSLNCDIGLGKVVELPIEETEERLKLTTYQWPIMHAVLDGVSRNQLMARHKSNHIQVAYSNGRREAIRALYAKAAAMHNLGIKVHFCGNLNAWDFGEA